MDEANKTEITTEKQGTLPRIYLFTVSEIPKLLPIAYLSMIGIGMIFNYYKYIKFGINIFQYASVFDFLISPFEDYIIILFTLFSLTLPTLLYLLDCFLEKRFPRLYKKSTFNLSGKRGYRIYRIMTYAFLILFYIWTMARAYGSFSYKQVLKQPDISVRYMDNETLTGKQIGKTSDMLFLYQGNDTTKAVPIHSLVKEIRYSTLMGE